KQKMPPPQYWAGITSTAGSADCQGRSTVRPEASQNPTPICADLFQAWGSIMMGHRLVPATSRMAHARLLSAARPIRTPLDCNVWKQAEFSCPTKRLVAHHRIT